MRLVAVVVASIVVLPTVKFSMYAFVVELFDIVASTKIEDVAKKLVVVALVIIASTIVELVAKRFETNNSLPKIETPLKVLVPLKTASVKIPVEVLLIMFVTLLIVVPPPKAIRAPPLPGKPSLPSLPSFPFLPSDPFGPGTPTY